MSSLRVCCPVLSVVILIATGDQQESRRAVTLDVEMFLTGTV